MKFYPPPPPQVLPNYCLPVKEHSPPIFTLHLRLYLIKKQNHEKKNSASYQFFCM